MQRGIFLAALDPEHRFWPVFRIRVVVFYVFHELWIPEWNDFCLQLIYFGRAICKVRKPACSTCPLYDLCDSPDKI